MRKNQGSSGKKVKGVWTFHENIHEDYVGKMDDDGCGRQEKERKTEAEVDGQCECGLEGEGTAGGGDIQLEWEDATCHIHRPHTEVGYMQWKKKSSCNFYLKWRRKANNRDQRNFLYKSSRTAE